MDLLTLKNQILESFSQLSCRFAFVFKNLSNPEDIILINENEVFHSASTMKVPVMMEIFRQAEAGLLQTDEKIEIKNQFHSIVDGSPFHLNQEEDSDPGLYELIGKTQTIRQLTEAVITKSSNLATNLLIDRVKAVNVTQFMQMIGTKNTIVLRGVEDVKAYRLNKNNTVTALDLMVIFEKLLNDKIFSAEYKHEMLEILMKQELNDLIPAKLPVTLKIAHKTGSLPGKLQHDAGIVFLPDGRNYFLAMLTQDYQNEKEYQKGTTKLAEISLMVFDYFSSNKS
jgi:beta-lactamase class A